VEKAQRIGQGAMMKPDRGLLPLGDIVKQAASRITHGPLAQLREEIKAANKPIKPLSRVQNRLLEPCPEHEFEICFQHSVFCQTGLPYRDPGDDVQLWKRKQGNAALEIEAGRIPDPASGEHINVGLPWGAKPRLILAHLNAEALRQGSPDIEIESSLSAFVKRIRGFDGGREIRMFKHQLSCLSTATIRLAVFRGNHAFGINTHVISAFDLWLQKDERQRVLYTAFPRVFSEPAETCGSPQ
jgi:hypothetical protein